MILVSYLHIYFETDYLYLYLKLKYLIYLALTFVNELQVLDFTWKEKFQQDADAASPIFWKWKKRVEEAVSI